ncbi:uncharacterized protein LOC125679553 [Ostrea edulis]|uniref:uncharacterized protein LOC125679553 n=1 Tax=Ostrea edulis TaxID=37623 RepID=UPI0024AE9747|nr:uncharacterized protein LOC125679553 [Ostrea edulis]XP_048774821.2 uncharacterized protein LOC125679553 [Ostrea edulis]XP_056012430.1 uncharacterized protein LOC125679553 [Ostrea edulis]XP_056012431.1 uncharacterized protein LOC125679553 [Ostrea edulis]
MTSDVCQAHSSHMINQHGMSRPNSKRYSLAFSGSRPKTEQPSVTSRDVTDLTDQESMVTTDRSSVLKRPLTARPMTRGNRTFVTVDKGGPNDTLYQNSSLERTYIKTLQGNHPTHVPSVINGYNGYNSNHDAQTFSGNIRDDEEYYLDMDPIEYFYSPVFDLYPYGYMLSNHSKNVKTSKNHSYIYPPSEDIESKENVGNSFVTNIISADSNPRPLKPVSDLTVKASPFPPKSRLPVPVTNPKFKKAVLKHDQSQTVQTIEYRRDLFEPKQKTTKMGPLTNNASLLSPGYQTEQTKAPNKRIDVLSNSKINYGGAKRKQNDTMVKTESSKSRLDVLHPDPEESSNSGFAGEWVNQRMRDDADNRLKSREKCSNNRLMEYSYNAPNYTVSKKLSELNMEKSSANGKQSVKYHGNSEKNPKFNDKWTSSGRVLDNRSLLTKQKPTAANQQVLFKPKAPEISNQNKSRDPFVTRRPFSEDINSVMVKENNHSGVKMDQHSNSPFVGKSKHPYLRTGKQLSLPRIRPQTEKPSVLELKSPNSPPRKLKPVLVKFDNMHF